MNNVLSNDSLTKINKIRVRFIHNPLLMIVSLVWLVLAIYISFIQTEGYQSTTKFVIEKSDSSAKSMLNLGILTNSYTNNSSDAYLLIDYLKSQIILDYLNQTLKFSQYYQNEDIDYFSRLSLNADNKHKLDYFNKKLTINFDEITHEVSMSIIAYDPYFSQKILKKLLFKSQEFINKITNASAKKQFEFSKTQLKRAQAKLKNMESKIASFQNRHNMYDPSIVIQMINEINVGLHEKLVKKQTELYSVQSYMQPSTFKITQLKDEISAIKRQIKDETRSLIGGQTKNKQLNLLLIESKELELELKFAKDEYQAAQKAVDLSYIDMKKEQNLLVEILPPNKPDNPISPNRPYELITYFIVLLMAFFLIKMIKLIVMEHTD